MTVLLDENILFAFGGMHELCLLDFTPEGLILLPDINLVLSLTSVLPLFLGLLQHQVLLLVGFVRLQDLVGLVSRLIDFLENLLLLYLQQGDAVL